MATDIVPVRMSKDEKSVLDKARKGKSRAEYIRELVARDANAQGIDVPDVMTAPPGERHREIVTKGRREQIRRDEESK